MKYAMLAALALVAVTPNVAFADDSVAGRPALTTKSASELITQREKWGTEPSKSTADASDKKKDG